MQRSRIALVLALVGILSTMALLSTPYVRAEEAFVDCRVTTCRSSDWVRALSSTPPLTRGGIPGMGGGSTAQVPIVAVPVAALNVHFASNSDKIPPKYYTNLNELGKALTQVPASIEIAGY